MGQLRGQRAAYAGNENTLQKIKKTKTNKRHGEGIIVYAFEEMMCFAKVLCFV